MTFAYAECFAGAGGMSLGFERAGLVCRWHAEIADFPRRALAHHWPETPLYGDVTTLDGKALVAAHGPVHLLSGGAPCQDLSVAGKRLGFTGERSVLYFELVRLWHETNAPYFLYENVAGALSSNRGADFAAVLSAIVGGAVPVPSDGWRSAGVVSGPTGVAAWRLLDAQWFGVPQRRLRVFVLGARGGGVDPAEVLLEPEGVRRHPPTRGEAREGTSRDAGDRVGFQSSQSGVRSVDTFATLDANYGSRRHNGVVAFDWPKGNDVNNVRPSTMNLTEEQTGTLGATRVLAVLSFGWQNSASQGDDASQGSDAPLRTGTTPAVLAFNTKQDGADADSVSPTLLAMPHDQSHANGGGQVGVVCTTGDITHALTHEGHDASEDGTGRGTPIVVFNETGHEKWTAEALSGSLNAHEAKDAHTLVVGTLESREHGGGFPGTDGATSGHVQATNGLPRRLMPVECERLMGWPDGWTDIPDEKGKPASDSVRYKACGNGVVSHCSQWIGARLVACHMAMVEAQERAA